MKKYFTYRFINYHTLEIVESTSIKTIVNAIRTNQYWNSDFMDSITNKDVLFNLYNELQSNIDVIYEDESKMSIKAYDGTLYELSVKVIDENEAETYFYSLGKKDFLNFVEIEENDYDDCNEDDEDDYNEDDYYENYSYDDYLADWADFHPWLDELYS